MKQFYFHFLVNSDYQEVDANFAKKTSTDLLHIDLRISNESFMKEIKPLTTEISDYLQVEETVLLAVSGRFGISGNLSKGHKKWLFNQIALYKSKVSFEFLFIVHQWQVLDWELHGRNENRS